MSGEIYNWSQIGGGGTAIQLIVGGPSQTLIEEHVLQSGHIPELARVFKVPRDAAYAVAGDPQAIGFIMHADKWDAEVRSVTVDGVDVTRTTILSNRYPYTQSMYFVVNDEDPESTSNLFVDYARSGAGQKIIDQLQLVGTS